MPRGALPSFSRLCGAVTFWFRHPFPLLSQYDSPLAQAEKTLPGMLERLGRLQKAPALVPEAPASLLLPGAEPGASLVETLALDVSYRHPLTLFFQFFSPTHHPYPGHLEHKIELGSRGAKGPSISAGQQATLALPRLQEWPLPPSFVLVPPYTPHHWGEVWRQGEVAGTGHSVLVSCPQAPSSLALANRLSLR